MPWQKGQSGNPRGKLPGLTTSTVRASKDARRLMVDGLTDATEALVDLARGVRVLHVIDGDGHAQLLPPDRARTLAAQPDVIDAALRAGQLRVYAFPPDLGAIKALQDRVLGRPPSHLEVQLGPELAQVRADHAFLAKVITQHVPAEYLAPVVSELERLAGREQGQHDGQP